MFPSLVRTCLEIYLREKRVITQSEIDQSLLIYASKKESVFVTLYKEGRVIASSGRIQCKKENTLFECIDNTLLCLKDERFSESLQTPESLEKISIRVDRFTGDNRRVLQKYNELDITKEGVILLSQNYAALGVILPSMVHIWSTPESYFELVCKKAGVDKNLPQNEYVLYGFTTTSETDFS